MTESLGSLDLSVVVPSYLEGENLRLLLPRIKQAVSSLSPKTEIVVIDTLAPLDDTSAVCEQLSVRYVPRRGGNFFGDAVRTGIEEAKGKWVIFMDADGSHAPELIPTLYGHRMDFDVVVASRYVDGGYTENSKPLIFMSKTVNFIYRIVLGLKCRDISNSFKLYTAGDLRNLKLKCQNFDIIEEILFKLNRSRKLRIKEIPCSFKKRMFGESKRNLFVFMLSYLFTILRLRFSR